MNENQPPVPLRGPSRSVERAPAPDLARGMMLLLIALANTPIYLWATTHSSSSNHPMDEGTLDSAVSAVLIVVADLRVYPMFAFLFGYGIVQLYLRQQAAGVSEADARALLRRRNLLLIAFGAVHALLLWYGDIIGAYGLVGLVLVALFLRRSDRTLLTWAGIGTGLLVLLAVLSVVGASFAAGPEDGQAATSPATDSAFMMAPIAEENPLWAAVLRIAYWPLIVIGQGVVGVAVPVAIVLAFWAARRRILEEPWNHLPLLRRTAVVGIAVGWLGPLPSALHHLGLLAVPEAAAWVFWPVQLATGLVGGIGYVALFGLIGARLRGRPLGRVGTAVSAVGKRSMSCYIGQSVLCAPILSAWGLGLGAHLGSAAMALFAVGVWLATLAFAVLLERAGKRGPAEVALRRLAYRRTTADPADAGSTTR
ncbi:DUF418 domain-containing protein [Nocardiopsis suaedae]|uniref:DUF418 domain-containing protein n=1 Tax=Nocardiopsis suaedae TaxID=3018444 RepID=A0ABT4TPF4_9ACTN|nr:DUF418 domain-containing protein [Nocardiopsis suaedae]MDA2806557.1 DUF418 domain-containing protein [Nocardiopsis suaedae]